MTEKKASEIVKNLSEEYGLSINPDLKVEECSVGMRQRIEILKVLYQDADIIIFDEPTAVLVPQEIDELLKTSETSGKPWKKHYYYYT